MHQEPTTREKVLASLEDAAMYSELGQDARDHATGAKDRWTKLRDRLDTVKQDHQEWRQGHKFSTWLHDNGWIKSNTLSQHEDRQRRYTTREADAHTSHLNARDRVRYLDKNLSQSQEQASTGWRQLEQEREQQEKAAQQRQEQASTSRSQQHEQASPSHTTARRPDPADRFTGELLESGFAPYLDVEKNSRSYFVKLRLEDGKETKHWGVDLERAVGEAGAGKGDRIRVQRTGENRSVEVDEEGKKIHAVRKGWEVTTLSHQQKLEQEPVAELTAREPERSPEPISIQPEPARSNAMDRIRAGVPEQTPALADRSQAAEDRIPEQSPTHERHQAMSQNQTFGSIELPRTKQELQQEQTRSAQGERVLETNVTLPEPGRRPPTLGEAVRHAMQPQQQAQRQDDQEQGSGGRRGGQERPSHSSFYQPIPVGGMAPPTPDERSAATQQQERSRRRDWGRSI